jgi:hypothetical protein
MVAVATAKPQPLLRKYLIELAQEYAKDVDTDEDRENFYLLAVGVLGLNEELERYRSAVVPRVDYDRVVAQRDHADAACDALTRELANARDASRARAAERACRALQGVMGTLARAAGGPGDLDAWSEARAVLAELGYVAPEVEEYRAETERWEEGR